MGELNQLPGNFRHRSSLFKRDFGILSTQHYAKLLTTARHLFQTISTRLLSIINDIHPNPYYSTHQKHPNTVSMAEITTMCFHGSIKQPLISDNHHPPVPLETTRYDHPQGRPSVGQTPRLPETPLCRVRFCHRGKNGVAVSIMGHCTKN